MATGSATSFSNVQETTGSATTTRTGGVTTGSTRQEQLIIDREGVDRIVEDLLGGSQGLADIFAADSASGIFGSSVAAQASGNLLAKVAGEVAKLTAIQSVSERGFEEEDRREVFDDNRRIKRSGTGLDLTGSTGGSTSSI